MIDFRYHVVSIVSVFLALALGLFIGATSLRDTASGDVTNGSDKLSQANGTLRSQNADLQNQLKNAQQVDNALLPYAVHGRLAGVSVVVISAPGIDNAIRTDVLRALPLSGATVAADVRLQDHLLDPQQDAFLGTLAHQVAIPGHPLPNSSGSVRALSLLAQVLVTGPRQRPVPRAAAARVLSAFSAGSLVSTSGDATQPGSVAVLIAPPGPAPGGRSTLLATFARYLGADAVGAVVIGPGSSDRAGGVIDLVRSDTTLRTSVSTVDDAEQPSGVITTVLALAERSRGRAGSYGTGPGSDAPMPTQSP